MEVFLTELSDEVKVFPLGSIAGNKAKQNKQTKNIIKRHSEKTKENLRKMRRF